MHHRTLSSRISSVTISIAAVTGAPVSMHRRDSRASPRPHSSPRQRYSARWQTTALCAGRPLRPSSTADRLH